MRWSGHEAREQCHSGAHKAQAGPHVHRANRLFTLCCGGVLQNAGFSLQFDPVKVKFKPTAQDMQIAEESGTDLAQAMLKRQRQKGKRSGGGAKAQSGNRRVRAEGRLHQHFLALLFTAPLRPENEPLT